MVSVGRGIRTGSRREGRLYPILNGDFTMDSFPWLFVVLGGAILLGIALAWGQFQSRKRDDQVDPNTPGDDPSKGL